MQTDARERWKAQHRQRRIRNRWLLPLKRRAGFGCYALAVAAIPLALLVSMPLGIAGVVALFAGLWLHGHPPGEVLGRGSGSGYSGGWGDGCGGGDGGSCGC